MERMGEEKTRGERERVCVREREGLRGCQEETGRGE